MNAKEARLLVDTYNKEHGVVEMTDTELIISFILQIIEQRAKEGESCILLCGYAIWEIWGFHSTRKKNISKEYESQLLFNELWDSADMEQVHHYLRGLGFHTEYDKGNRLLTVSF